MVDKHGDAETPTWSSDEMEVVDEPGSGSEGEEEETSDEEESGESSGSEEGSGEDEEVVDKEGDGSGDEETEWEEDWESDSSESEEENEKGDEGKEGEGTSTMNQSTSSTSGLGRIAGYSSDSSSGETERCPICLGRLDEHDVGSPESCDHTFCLPCILEWSKNVNTCPVDRQVYRLILARHEMEGVVYKKIPVEDRQVEDEGIEEDDHTYCEVCGNSNREDRLLLCDGCDLGFHCECLDPPLRRVPVEEWFCPTCAAVNQAATTTDEPSIEFEDEPRTRQRRVPPRRQIARTLVAERVRAVIAQSVTRRRRRIVSDSESEGEANEVRPSASTSTRKTPAAKSRTTRKKRTVKKRGTRKTTKKRKKKKVPTATLR